MGEFSLLGFAAHLTALKTEMAIETHEALEHAAVLVETEAKKEIGTYQGNAGPFAAWQQLSPNTLHGGVSPSGHRYEGKIPLGYATATEHNPLLREGDLRDSIQHVVGVHEAEVGSNSDVAVWQERGTRYMPARSFLGGSAFRKSREIRDACAIGAVQTLMGGGRRIKVS